MKKIILLTALIFFIPMALAETVESVTYTEFSEQINYFNGRHILRSGVSNLQDAEGNWKPFTEVVNINYHDYALRFSYNQYWVEYEPYVIRNGNKYTLEWIINNFDNVRDHIDFNNNRDSYKWALTIKGIPENLKEGVTHIGFDYKDSNNLSWSDIVVDGNLIIIKNKIALSVADLKWHNYSVDFNKETIMIGNLDANYWYHGVLLSHWIQDSNGLWSITFDPTIIKSVAQSSDDASNSNPPIEAYNETNETEWLANEDLAGFHIGFIFQDINISQGTTVNTAKITLSTWATCGGGESGYECRTIWHGFDTDDANTWESTANEPKDAELTTANYDYNTTFNNISNGFYTSIDFNALSLVNEILSRENLNQPDTNMGFVFEDNGSIAPARKNSTFKVYMYDNTSGAPTPKLTIEYTSAVYSISVAYNSNCGQNQVFFNERNGEQDGSDDDFNAGKIKPQGVRGDMSDANCWNASNSFITITNDGDLTADIDFNFSTAPSTGLWIKWWMSPGTGCSWNGYSHPCTIGATDTTTPVTQTTCRDFNSSNGANKARLISSLASSDTNKLCAAGLMLSSEGHSTQGDLNRTSQWYAD